MDLCLFSKLISYLVSLFLLITTTRLWELDYNILEFIPFGNSHSQHKCWLFLFFKNLTKNFFHD